MTNIVYSPALQAPIALAPPAAQVALVGQGPGGGAQAAVTPNSGAVQLAPTAPLMGSGMAVPPAAVTVAGAVASAIAGVVTPRQPASAAMALGGAAPVLTQASPGTGQTIVWKPMHIWKTGTDGSRTTPINGSLQTCFQYMDAAIAADVNNLCGAFAFCFYWSALESPGGGVYDGSWDSTGNSGFAIVQALINHAKAYNPPRSVVILLNLTGNGLGANSGGLNTASFPGWFVPQYLQNLAGADGGCYWVGRGTGWVQPPIATFWEPVTAQRIVNLIQAFYNKFGPDTATGGIYMWDLTSELSIGNGSSWSTPLFLSTCQNTLFPGVRAAAPRQMFFFRPTFLPGGDSNPNYYVQLLNAAQQYSIAFGNEDGTNTIPGTSGQHTSFDWGGRAYCGLTVAGAPLGTPDQSTAGQMAYVFNCEDNEFGNVDNPIPPAKTGSGYFYNRSDFPGIFQGAVRVGATHCIWHIDNVYGPNLYRSPPQQTGTAPAAPTPGPNAGSKSARPNIFDLLTENQAYASVGIQPKGTIAIPVTAYPSLFPKAAPPGTPQNFLMISQEANAATFTCTPVTGATYNLYRATISPQGVVGAFAVVATSTTLPIRDGTATNLSTPGPGPYPYIPATGYRYALSVTVGGLESTKNFNLQMWIYGTGGKSGGVVGPNGPAFWSQNLSYGGTNNPTNTTHLQSGSSFNWAITGNGFQPRSSDPFLVDPTRTLDFAETSMFNFMNIDIYWFNTGDTVQINAISRVSTGDNFNSAQFLLGDPSTTDLGPASIGGQWMTYKIPFLGNQGHSCQLGYGSIVASVSGTTLTVTAVNSPGLNMEGSNYLTGPGLTVGQLNGPALTPWVTTTPNGAPGGPGTYGLGTNQGTIGSETIYMQRTDFYKTGVLPGNGQTTQFLIDNWGLSVQ